MTNSGIYFTIEVGRYVSRKVRLEKITVVTVKLPIFKKEHETKNKGTSYSMNMAFIKYKKYRRGKCHTIIIITFFISRL